MHCQVMKGQGTKVYEQMNALSRMKGQGTKVYEQVNALSSDERSGNQGL